MADAISTGLNVILGIMILAIISLGTFIYIQTRKYRHTAIIKDAVSGNKVVSIDKFKVLRKKDGTVWWLLKNRKKELVPAPKTCVEIDKKGSMVVQYYLLDGDTFVPAKDGFDPNDSKNVKEIIDEMKPFSTEERSIMINQQMKSMRDKKSTLAEKVTAAIPYMAVIMILVIFMIFFNDAVKPIKEVGDQYSSVASSLATTADKLDNILHDRVHIYGEENLGVGVIGDEQIMQSIPGEVEE